MFPRFRRLHFARTGGVLQEVAQLLLPVLNAGRTKTLTYNEALGQTPTSPPYREPPSGCERNGGNPSARPRRRCHSHGALHHPALVRLLQLRTPPAAPLHPPAVLRQRHEHRALHRRALLPGGRAPHIAPAPRPALQLRPARRGASIFISFFFFPLPPLPPELLFFSLNSFLSLSAFNCFSSLFCFFFFNNYLLSLLKTAFSAPFFNLFGCSRGSYTFAWPPSVPFCRFGPLKARRASEQRRKKEEGGALY